MKLKKKPLRSIRIRIIKIMAMMFIAVAAAVYLILNTVMLNQINMLEKRYTEEHLLRAKHLLEEEGLHLAAVVFDWAVWDPSYAYIRDQNESFVETNLGVSTYENLKLTAIAFVDEQGVCVYAKEYDRERGVIRPASAAFIDALQTSPIIHNGDPAYRVQGLLMLPGRPLLIAACPILPSETDQPVRGHLIMGTDYDADKISQMAKMLNVNLSVYSLEAAAKGSVPLLADLSDVVQVIPEENKVAGTTVLSDVYGDPALRLRIEIPREIHEIGSRGLEITLMLVIGIFILFAIWTLTFLDKSVLRRLSNLSEEIRKIGQDRIFSNRLRAQPVQDELTAVTDEINSMLGELESGQIQLAASEQGLKKANDELERRVWERTVELVEANENLQKGIVERAKTQEKMEYIAYHDSMTGLPNRLLFSQLLSEAVYDASRAGKMLAVLFLDIDSFKMINDTMGHAVGDQLLQEVAERLTNSLRREDVVARFGGDEFIILISRMEDVKCIELIAEKLLSSFYQPFTLNDQDCFMTTSIGIAIYPMDGRTADQLIKNADIAMYKAKENGKNQYVLCTPHMRNIVSEMMRLSNKLYRAMERQQLEVYYQPQVDCQTGGITGMEALLRWNHPELGMVSPAKFIPLAEQTGLVIPIGEWILRTACTQAKQWQEEGLDRVKLGVNLSLKQFQNHDIVAQVRGILAETRLEAEYLELEVTEGIAMEGKEYILKMLNTFKAMGIQIAIDDFGTDYSSLRYIKDLPASRLKIAMNFIQGIGVEPDGLLNKDEALTKAIIVLAKSLGIKVIAEGVETEKQLHFLQQWGCDEIQGYYFFAPLSAKAMGDLLRERKNKG
ncbi:MAG: bifunctional diguanylate cyclase/phosphodiesterase [Selenomonadaceae bacterium]